MQAFTIPPEKLLFCTTTTKKKLKQSADKPQNIKPMIVWKLAITEPVRVPAAWNPVHLFTLQEPLHHSLSSYPFKMPGSVCSRHQNQAVLSMHFLKSSLFCQLASLKPLFILSVHKTCHEYLSCGTHTHTHIKNILKKHPWMLQNKQTHVLTLSNRNPHLKSQLGIKMPLAVKTREEVSKVVDWRSGRRGEYNSVIFFYLTADTLLKKGRIKLPQL